MDPLIETPRFSDDYERADSFLQFSARQLHKNVSPYQFGRTVLKGNNFYFVDAILGSAHRNEYMKERGGAVYCSALRIYMHMRPEEYERMAKVFLADKGTDVAFKQKHGRGSIITNNVSLPIKVNVSSGGVWVEVCDSRETHKTMVYTRRLMGGMNAPRDNWLHGEERGVDAKYHASDGSSNDEEQVSD